MKGKNQAILHSKMKIPFQLKKHCKAKYQREKSGKEPSFQLPKEGTCFQNSCHVMKYLGGYKKNGKHDLCLILTK